MCSPATVTRCLNQSILAPAEKSPAAYLQDVRRQQFVEVDKMRRWLSIRRPMGPLLATVLATLPGAIAAQAPAHFSPVFAVGGSKFLFDERGPYNGIAVKAGAGVHPYLDAVLVGEHWPTLGGANGWSAQIETSLYPAGRRPVAPRIVLGVGRFWTTPPTQSSSQGVRGFTRSFGLGLQAHVSQSVALELDALMRYDAYAADLQLRLLAGRTARSLARPLPGPPRVAATVSHMVPVRGPWELFEPAFGVRLTTPLANAHSASLGVVLLRWRIPSVTNPRGYSWATGALLVTPGWQWNRYVGRAGLRARLGPAFTLSGEGPDNGLRAGAQLEVGGSVRLGSVPLTAGVGWLWISRHVNPGGSTPGTDQHGLMLSVGLGY